MVHLFLTDEDGLIIHIINLQSRLYILQVKVVIKLPKLI